MVFLTPLRFLAIPNSQLAMKAELLGHNSVIFMHFVRV